MQITTTPQPKSQIQLKVELSVEEMKPFLDKAASALSAKYKIEGFRPGKASVGIVIQKLGVEAVWQEAAELAVRKTFPDAIIQEKIRSVGHPHIAIIKLAADNPFIYQAQVAVLPEIKLGNYQQLKAKKKSVTIKPEEMDKAVEELQTMFAKESPVDRPAQTGDKLEVDFDLTVDHVAVEGGSSKNHPMVIGSKNFIPGFEENLVGMKKDDQKNFSLPFPADYHNKQLAGKKGDFATTVKTVIEVVKPTVDDAFAKQAGKFESVAELRSKIEENLQHEADHEADMEWERALMDELINQTTIGEIPDILLTSETEKMLHEIEDEISQRGLSMDDYLQGLKKTKDELSKEFQEPAIRRIKSAIILRHIALAENVIISDDEVNKEVQQVLAAYKDQPELVQRIDSEDYRSYIRNILVNRKVVGQLKEWANPAAPAKF